ncbi:MAG TPA: DUF190 domain-containing protein [Gemmatimonadaceae bacterium]
MLRGLKGERVLMRIHIGERDRHDGKPLYEAIVNLLRRRGYAGATVFRGVMGFGASGRISADHMELLAFDLPLVIECVDTQEKIETILPEIDQMIDAGLITLERAKVILYRAKREGSPPNALAEEDRIDITGDWQQHE